jgi:PAS domain S-box-containing protein
MTWIDLLWPMLGAACLTLALIHALAALGTPFRPAQLMFAIVAGSVGLLALVELWLMDAGTPAAYAQVLRWAQVLVTVVVLAIVAFVRLRFRAGKPWLAALVVGLRLAAAVANVTTGDNLNFAHTTHLAPVLLWGGVEISTPVGEANPWMALGTLSNIALIAFLLDATLATLRRGDRREGRVALLACGSLAAFVVISAVWGLLVVTGVVHGPMTLNVGFVAVVLVMSYVVGSDVTLAARLSERLARSQGDLHESERRMQQAADAADLGLWTMDLATDEFWFTDTSHVLLGWNPGDRIRPGDILARVHPDDRKAFAQARVDALAGGDYHCEFRLRLPDGRLRWLTARGRVDHALDGTPCAIRGVVLDRTERRQADERFRLVVEAAPTAMLMIDSAGRVTLANTQAERVFGYRREEMIGQPVELLVPDRSREGALEPGGDSTAVLAEAADVRGLPLARRKDGTRFPIELGVTPLVVEGDACIIATVDDLSDRLRRESEAALQRDELAHLSRVTLVGEMSGSLAHELNQPLAAVLSNAQAGLRFLDHQPPPLEEVRDCLVHIVENDKRAAEVIRRLRTMLRKEPAEHKRIDASDLVEDVVRLMRNDLLNRNVAVTLELDPDLPKVDGDRVQLQQVLLNLLVNACDAMDRDGGERVVSVTTRQEQGDVEIAVCDQGPGIPPDQLELIFSPFVTSKAEGIGLGLAICRSIVTAHHGTLRATNNPGRGATFRVALPIPP